MPRRFLLLLAVILAVGVGAWAVVGRSSARQEQQPARPAPQGPEVTVAAVARREAAISLHSVGTVQPIKSVQILPQVEGAIRRVAFTDGQMVKAGDVLFEIDPRPYQAALAQAQGQAQSDEANLGSARQDFARTSQLAQNGWATRQTQDQQRARVAQLEAVTRTNQGRIDQARIDLERTVIRAPIAGRISEAELTEGNIVRPGQTTVLTTINQIAPIDVQFTVPQDQLGTVQARNAQKPLVVSVQGADAGPQLATGELVFIDNRVDPTTGTVAMKARFRNEDGRLWPGQFVNVTVELERRPDAVVVDSRAVQTGPNGRYVYVVQDGKAEIRPVKLAVLEETQGIVSEGLRGGERVVVDGQVKIVPGGPVRVRDPQRQNDQNRRTAENAPAAQNASGQNASGQNASGQNASGQNAPAAGSAAR